MEIVLLRTGDQLQAAARLLWQVWGAVSDAERTTLISAGTLHALAHAGNYVAGAYVDGELAGCTVAFFGARSGRVDHLHSDITGVLRSDRGVGSALKRHQRQWALDHGLDTITWTFDPLLARNAYFNLCKLGAVVTGYRPDFYGTLDDGTNTGDQTDRLLVEWPLTADWVTTGRRRHALPVPGAELIAVPGERLPVRDRFLALLATGHQVAGMTRNHEYVLLPPGAPAQYES